MNSDSNSELENERIRRVYAQRDQQKAGLYAYHRADLRLQIAQRDWELSAFLYRAFGADLGSRRFLDVGCGKGTLLRTLIEWGADPAHCVGTELLADRIAFARKVSPAAITWHLGDLRDLTVTKPFDLVSAFIVFSSILDQKRRAELASEMWERVVPGGWLLLFDIALNNPSNPDVRKVTRSELAQWWPATNTKYIPLLLAPPLARRIAPRSFFLAMLTELLLPFARSHFCYVAQKP